MTVEAVFTAPRAPTLPRRAEGPSLSCVMLPTAKGSVREFVFRSDPWYRFLAGNRPEVTKETCGKWDWKGCLNHKKHGFSIVKGQVKLIGGLAKRQDKVKGKMLSCGKLDCPVCYEKAGAKAAHRAERRMVAFNWRRVIRMSREKDPDFVPQFYMKDPAKKYHWAVSVPKDLYHLSREELLPIARKVATMAGIDGGCMVFHHLRGYVEDDRKEDLAAGFSWKTAPASWYFSPHFHVVGVGFTSSDKIQHMNDETRWVVVNLGERTSVKSTVQYQLSHAYIPEGRGHSMTWFGCMSYNKFKSAAMSPKDPDICSECGLEFRKLRFVNSEAEAIVKSKVTGEGLYHFDHGFFEYADEDPPPWMEKYGGRN